ncbi:hypothetical protein GV794_15500 [Nocardia cyriacigeorgica]|uniref:Uncharacterized protein n=1 Tax=Nocardia cyriacigeorgica TaxID=135487 RepID=A0ABX0CKR8_9NOCA|nr:hypothetical protein [Nocardia cyriacigeorgica]NEW57050.1 hypothetical protein [Nocardia cyriacigeorgica]
MTHGPDSTTRPATIHRTGAVTLADKSTPRSAFDTAIQRMLTESTQVPAPTTAPRAGRIEPAVPITGRRRHTREQRSVHRSQRFRAVPQRPLRIPGR